jgi:hypothetical protein
MHMRALRVAVFLRHALRGASELLGGTTKQPFVPERAKGFLIYLCQK